MVRRKGELTPTSKSKLATKQAFLALARKRFEAALENDKENRADALDDLKFYNGDQWPDTLKKEREQEGRPCLVINKLQEKVDQVVGDQRQNRPQIQIIPVDGNSDPDTAETMEGLIRNIEYTSDAEEVYDMAFESAVICGRGWFRILTEYSDDDVFEQDIVVESIPNPFSVYWDAGAQKRNLSDAMHMFVTELLTEEQFNSRYPGKRAAPLDVGDQADFTHWRVDDKIRIAGYWIKVPMRKTIFQLSDGTVTDIEPEQPQMVQDEITGEEYPDGPTVARSRIVDSFKVVQYVISGADILEGPNWWAGKYIPLIPVWGKELNIAGARKIRGLVRYAKDPQKMFNYWESKATEQVALAPLAPYIITARQIRGHEKVWKEAHKRTIPYLVYEHDENAPPPKRQSGPGIPTGLEQRAKVNSEHIKSTTGLYDPSLGARSNETSGRAILLRQREGDTATYAFIDNLARAIRWTGKILVDLIPKIYDTERMVRVTDIKGEQTLVPINVQQGQEKINALDVGKYDVVVKAGPSFTTQREEAVDAMMQIAQANSEIFLLIGDVLVQNMDWPGAQQIAKRLQPVAQAMLARLGGAPEQEEEQQEDPILQYKVGEAEARMKGAQYNAEKSKAEAAAAIAAAGFKLPAAEGGGTPNAQAPQVLSR